MPDPTLIVLALAALVAGFVDAVVGGGGLVQLPSLLLAFPGAAPVQLLATNKLSSVFGTGTASLTYYRRVRPDPRTFGPLMALAFVGAGGGALLASSIPRSAFDPVVLVALVVVGTVVVARPRLGERTRLRLSGTRHTAGAMAAGLGVGFYDGLLGPGTGSFFVFGLVGLLGYSFLEAGALARLANAATNLAALCVFVPQGAVMWHVGLTMGVCNLAGGYAGARTAVARGPAFVRVFFVVVVTLLAARIAWGMLD